ncbi:hypothetical protein D3C73_1280390 [compost metagenome]
MIALVAIPILVISPQAAKVLSDVKFPSAPINIPNNKPKEIGSPKKPSFFCSICGFNFILLNPIALSIGSKAAVNTAASILCIAIIVQFGY